jgi:hypothetical protein
MALGKVRYVGADRINLVQCTDQWLALLIIIISYSSNSLLYDSMEQSPNPSTVYLNLTAFLNS